MNQDPEAGGAVKPASSDAPDAKQTARIAAQAAVALVLTPVLVHGLGKTEYGIWTLVLSLALYLELFEFGLGAATVKSVAEDEAHGDRERTHRSIATSFWMLMVPGVAALVFGAVVAAVFPLLFDIPNTSDQATRILVLLIATDLSITDVSFESGACGPRRPQRRRRYRSITMPPAYVRGASSTAQ